MSGDRNFKEFKAHVKDMPWFTLPHYCPGAQALKKLFNVTDYPKLVFLQISTISKKEEEGF